MFAAAFLSPFYALLHGQRILELPGRSGGAARADPAKLQSLLSIAQSQDILLVLMPVGELECEPDESEPPPRAVVAVDAVDVEY